MEFELKTELNLQRLRYKKSTLTIFFSKYLQRTQVLVASPDRKKEVLFS